MSALETRAQPFLRPLITGSASTLSQAALAAIATWAVKTAMVFEAFRVDENWFYSNADREHVRQQARPPKRTSVWLGRHAGKQLAFTDARDLSGVQEDKRPWSAYVTTFASGQLLIQLSSGRLPADVPDTTIVDVDVKAGPWDQATIRAWPRSGEDVQWPPAVAVDDAGPANLDAFSDRWGDD